MKAYVSIDEGGYPVFNLTQDKVSGVEISAPTSKIARWRRTFAAYAKMQTELHELVDEYQPAAITQARSARVAAPSKK